MFNSEASQFSIVVGSPSLVFMSIRGAGIVNDSGLIQNIVVASDPAGNIGRIDFYNNAATGSPTSFTTQANPVATLAYGSTLAGPVKIGSGNGSGAYLAPGVTGADTLTITDTLTFRADGSYNCDLAFGQAKADQVIANGVTIESGAQFVFLPKGIQMLTNGTIFTVINNTSTTPINGAFANMPEGSKLATGSGNKLCVSYEGGDGNDLTLTVVK